ncbi:MAG: FG-GAP-like repeat-containing protein [Pseudomonadota bacterium]
MHKFFNLNYFQNIFLLLVLLAFMTACESGNEASDNFINESANDLSKIKMDTIVDNQDLSNVGTTIEGTLIKYDYSSGCTVDGRPLATGDFNGDGAQDYLNGDKCYNAGGSSTIFDGRVYLNYGPVTITNLRDSDAIFDSESSTSSSRTDKLGAYVTSIDINNDGYDDIIMGAINNDHGGTNDTGAIYIIWGSSTELAGTYDLATDLDYSGSTSLHGVKYYGDGNSFNAGTVANAGDVNADGIDDLLIGVEQDSTAGSSAGSVYLLYGNANLDTYYTSTNNALSTITPTASTAGVQFTAENAGDHLYRVRNAGDVDGDGFADFLIGATYYQASTATAASGAVYLVYGNNSAICTMTSPISLTDIISSSADFAGAIFYADDKDDNAGYAFDTAGDIDNDTYDEIIIGVYSDESDSSGLSSGTPGTVFIIKGSATRYSSGYELNDVSTLPNDAIKFNGESNNDQAGYSVAGAGDVNGDGYDDVLIGARKDDDGALDAGAAYLIYGSEDLSGFYDLTYYNITFDAAKFVGKNANDYTGTNVVSLNDIDFDGYNDFAIIAPNTASSSSSKSKIYLIFGDGDEETVYFNGLKQNHDFDGDGDTDLILFDTDTGEVRIVLMEAGNKSSSSWLNDPVQDLDYNLEGFGDFNNDGKTDILWRKITPLDSSDPDYDSSCPECLPMEIWLMDGISNTVVELDYGYEATTEFIGIADYDNNGYDDIYWNAVDTVDPTVADILVTIIDGTSTTDEEWVEMYSTVDYTLQGIGDFNGDGRCDVLFIEEASNKFYGWLNMSDSYVYQKDVNPAISAYHELSGLADFTGDGKTDLITRQLGNKFTISYGEVHIWMMSGCSITGKLHLGTEDAYEWELVDILDTEGNGTNDLLYRSRYTNLLKLWEMDGITRVRTSLTFKFLDDDSMIFSHGDFNNDTYEDIMLWNPPNGYVRNFSMDASSVLSLDYFGRMNEFEESY